MIHTRLTERFDLIHPVLSAPMAIASGGALASAVTRAGGLGFIGGGYGDADWTMQAFDDADGVQVGCGFITWKLAENPALLTRTLQREPAALFLSFGDPAPFAGEIVAAKVPLICQVQTLRDACHAAAWDAGNVAVANTFVGEAAGLIRERAPAGEIIENMVTEAEALLRGASARLEG